MAFGAARSIVERIVGEPTAKMVRGKAKVKIVHIGETVGDLRHRNGTGEWRRLARVSSTDAVPQ